MRRSRSDGGAEAAGGRGGARSGFSFYANASGNPTCSRRFFKDHLVHALHPARIPPYSRAHARVNRCRWIAKALEARVLLPGCRSRFTFRRWLSVLILGNFIPVFSRKRDTDGVINAADSSTAR